MTEEEFLKKYQGKFIEVVGFEIAWIFEVLGADFSKGNSTFYGWIYGKRTLLAGKDTIELYHDPNFDKDEIILRPEDKINVYPNKEALEKRIIEYLKENLIKYEDTSGDRAVSKECSAEGTRS